MSRKADLKRLVAPLLKREPTLALTGHGLVLGPTRHILRIVAIVPLRSGKGFTARAGAVHLFGPTYDLAGLPGAPLPGSDGDVFAWDAPDLAVALAAEIEAALPRLAPLGEIAAYAAWTQEQDAPDPAREAMLALAMGRWDVARAGFARLRDDGAADPKDRRRAAELVLPALEAGDARLIGALLREWETASAWRLRLGTGWAPSPFPFEANEVSPWPARG